MRAHCCEQTKHWLTVYQGSLLWTDKTLTLYQGSLLWTDKTLIDRLFTRAHCCEQTKQTDLSCLLPNRGWSTRSFRSLTTGQRPPTKPNMDRSVAPSPEAVCYCMESPPHTSLHFVLYLVPYIYKYIYVCVCVPAERTGVAGMWVWVNVTCAIAWPCVCARARVYIYIYHGTDSVKVLSSSTVTEKSWDWREAATEKCTTGPPTGQVTGTFQFHRTSPYTTIVCNPSPVMYYSCIYSHTKPNMWPI